MPWHYKNPDTFAANIGATIRAATLDLNQPHILTAFRSRSEAEALQEMVRYYKYCVRNTPGHSLSSTIENFDVRTSIKLDEVGGFTVLLTVRPTKISDFVELNADLAKEVLKQI